MIQILYVVLLHCFKYFLLFLTVCSTVVLNTYFCDHFNDCMTQSHERLGPVDSLDSLEKRLQRQQKPLCRVH